MHVTLILKCGNDIVSELVPLIRNRCYYQWTIPGNVTQWRMYSSFVHVYFGPCDMHSPFIASSWRTLIASLFWSHLSTTTMLTLCSPLEDKGRTISVLVFVRVMADSLSSWNFKCLMSMFVGSSQVNLYTLMPSIAFSAMMVCCRKVGAGGGSVNFSTKLNKDTVNKYNMG